MTDRLLTLSEVATEFGVSSVTVARWAHMKLLMPAFISPGGHKRFRRADIDRFKLANVVRHTGRLPDDPTEAETVESKINTFLDNMATTHSHLVWRPARKLRYDTKNMFRDAHALARLDRENETRKQLDEGIVFSIAGQTQQEFVDEIARTSLAEVAKRLDVSVEALIRFCRACRLRVELPREAPKPRKMTRRKR